MRKGHSQNLQLWLTQRDLMFSNLKMKLSTQTAVSMFAEIQFNAISRMNTEVENNHGWRANLLSVLNGLVGKKTSVLEEASQQWTHSLGPFTCVHVKRVCSETHDDSRLRTSSFCSWICFILPRLPFLLASYHPNLPRLSAQ